ncbi:energy transducer TonB [Brumimicrobium mesophilum]|uniref:energy transducer TonB n=1 Tax=Brumimicrobium mesophilum TaxID=392717 RepID=UPI000D14225E|nr:energy transducer TonB [Brumimicrobium mesophilum]
MKLIPFLFLTFAFILTSCGATKFSKSDEIVDYPDIEAEYPGGVDAMRTFLSSNINYPDISMELGDQGRVFVQFVIEKDGSLTNIEVLRGVSDEIDEESIRVIAIMPAWTPAIYKRKYVRARARMPINYILE